MTMQGMGYRKQNSSLGVILRLFSGQSKECSGVHSETRSGMKGKRQQSPDNVTSGRTLGTLRPIRDAEGGGSRSRKKDEKVGQRLGGQRKKRVRVQAGRSGWTRKRRSRDVCRG